MKLCAKCWFDQKKQNIIKHKISLSHIKTGKKILTFSNIEIKVGKEFDSKPVYNTNFLKIKIKSYGDEVTDFYDKKDPKVDSNHTCFAIITLDSALKKDDNYYPLAFSERM